MYSTVGISHCHFLSTYYGSIFYLFHSEVSSSHSMYSNNTLYGLLALDKENNIAIFDSCIFQNNTAINYAFVVSNGSTIIIQDCLWEHNTFEKNSSANREYEFMIFCVGCMIMIRETTISNTQSYATMGGILMASYSDVSFHNCNFMHNSGQNYIFGLTFSNTSVINTTISQNTAVKGDFLAIADGITTEFQGLTVRENRGNIKLMRSNTNFSDGIVYFNNNGSIIAMSSTVYFSSNTNLFIKCESQNGGIVTSEQSTLHFYGTTYFLDNYSLKRGGAVFATSSKVYIHHKIIIANNTAKISGGGIYLYQSELYCQFNCTFFQNYAVEMGGGVHAVSSKINVDIDFIEEDQNRYILFAKNRARLGGAMNFEQNSKLSLVDQGLGSEYMVGFLENNADYGGAVYVNDNVSSVCESKYYTKHMKQTECFLIAYKLGEAKMLITFSENSASIAGFAIFGGLLDRCTVNPIYTDDIFDSPVQPYIDGLSFLTALSDLRPTEVASHPVRVCYCYNNYPDCNYDIPLVVLQRGEKLSLSLVAVDQVNRTINATIHSVVSSTRDVGFVKRAHDIVNTCTNLKITVFLESKQLALFAIGPCNNTGISQRIIKIQFLDCICPIGFWPTDNEDFCECNCDPKLPKVIKICTLQSASIIREDNIWIGYINSTIDSGYLIYPNCPFDYCHPAFPAVSINFNTPNGTDAQCAPHRTGLLCGQCQPSFSLSFGGTACVACPKTWPGLLTANLIVQIFAGILIIGLILMLNLTVAAGTFNGLLFYANIVARNKNIFLPFTKHNVLTIFIECLNLELGIERCYFNGMNAYTKTWAQLIFPTYMFLLVMMVISVSRRSSIFTRLITKGNPVATLATIILLSYTTILRIIIDIFSFAILKYPDGSRHVVWLPDANIKYLKGKHILLFLTATVIVIIGMVYTALLFSWQWLLKAPHVKVFVWIRNTKLNSFMDAYLAPHTLKSRYWTGLLLFTRVVLYILSAVNVSGDPSFNLLAIGVTVAILLLLQLYSRSRIYKSVILDCFETASYFNLLLLTIVTFYSLANKQGQETIAYISTSVALVMFLSALLYHILLKIYRTHCLKTAKQFFRKRLVICKRRNDLNVNLLENAEMCDHATAPTTTVVGISPQHSSTTSDEEDIN